MAFFVKCGKNLYFCLHKTSFIMKKLILSALLMLCVSAFAQKQYTLQSPDGNIVVTIEAGEQLTYSVTIG